jgi:hypothetical protein
MSQAAKAQEPSMEEILASIRRIIADDDAAKTPPKPTEPAAKAAPTPAPAPPKPAPAPPPKPAAAAPKPAPPPPEPAPPASVQDDIDAMFAAAEAEAEPKPEPEPEPEPEPAEILDLTEAMEAPAEPEPPALRRIDGSSDVVYNEAAEPPPTVATARRNFEQSTGADRSLLAASTTAAVDSALNSLAQTVLVQNSRTLDDLVREMLRPMLKAWLDDNLPVMVERLVRAEIERVSRGRG